MAGDPYDEPTEYLPKQIRDLARAYLHSLPFYDGMKGENQSGQTRARHGDAEFYVSSCLTEAELVERAA